MDKRIAAVIVVVIIAGASAYYYYEKTTYVPTVKTVPYYVMLTDPPLVPAGTSSLNLTYSNVAVHIVNGSWIYLNSTGTVNLMQLNSVAQVIGQTSLPAGSEIDRILFVIASVKIDVNGTVSNVYMASNTITAPVINPQGVEAPSSGVLDLNPVVNTVYVGSEPLYILQTGAAAVNLANVNVTSLTKINMTQVYNPISQFLKLSETVSLSGSGKNTDLTISVYNNGNDSVEISGFQVFGVWEFSPVSLGNGSLVVSGIRAYRFADFVTINGSMSSVGNQIMVPKNLSGLESVIPFGNYSGMRVNFTGIYENLSKLPVPWQNVSSIWNGNISYILKNQGAIVKYFSNTSAFNQSMVSSAINGLEQGNLNIQSIEKQLNQSASKFINRTGISPGQVGTINITKILNQTSINSTSIKSILNNSSTSYPPLFALVQPVYAQPTGALTGGTWIPAHGSYTFTFNGEIIVFEGGGETVVMYPIAGNVYRVQSFDYLVSTSNVTAT
ncbi:MAG: hypothetical protein JRN01_05080 [Nitrososphaerota archaeon]|nr:hypothetical protein [Nitrososphaerota archaeon]